MRSHHGLSEINYKSCLSNIGGKLLPVEEQMDYWKTYSEMSDDEILNVARDSSSLEEQARIAIAGELRRRKLSERDITQYCQHLESFKPEDFWGKDEYIASSINGCGTFVYGKRDFERDGSFVTTKWLIVFFIPVVPLASMRVKALSFDWLPFVSTRYLVRSKERLCSKQVASVYSYLLLLLLTLATRDFLPTSATSIFLGVACVLPWLLRRLARARASKSVKVETLTLI
jgi:hypothetical protein